MKFTRTQLLRAKDVQLHSIGLNRTNTPGWLKKALAMEFTEEQVRLFTEARHAIKVKTKPIDAFMAKMLAMPPEKRNRLIDAICRADANTVNAERKPANSADKYEMKLRLATPEDFE